MESAEILPSYSELVENNTALQTKVEHLEANLHNTLRQLEFLKSQVFGKKNERRVPEPVQHPLLPGMFPDPQLTVPEEDEPEQVTSTRKKRRRPLSGVPGSEDIIFDPDVPIKTITLPLPEGATEEDVISTTSRYRLAQKPASYVVLEYVHSTVKVEDKVTSTQAPPSPIPGSVLDVSFLAGMVIDKVLYHLPLYRQHKRLLDAKIQVDRATLSRVFHTTGMLLQPIAAAILGSIKAGKIITMDETPTKAGRGKKKMKEGYFWPIYGDNDELYVVFSPTRAHSVVSEYLNGFEGTLLSDGYGAYEAFVAGTDTVLHAQCWSHTRRKLLEAEALYPTEVGVALSWIRKLYRIEKEIKNKPPDKRVQIRREKSLPVVEGFFENIKQIQQSSIMLSGNPLTTAVQYTLKREQQLRLFLTDPELAPDTNHVERALRGHAIGRRNWLFCQTEKGAEHVAVFYSLLWTCRLHNVDPWKYLVDVLQRIDSHPQSQINLLTPRLWKENFQHNRIPSALEV